MHPNLNNSTSEPTRVDGLPSPDDRPEADVVIFDADCNICTRSVKRLPFWDCQQHLSYMSLHDPTVYERYPDLTHEALMEQMVLIDREGNRLFGPYAIRYLTKRLRRLWWLMPIAYFPGSMWLWKPLYRLVAKNRYRFNRAACDGGTCKLHR